MDGTWVHTHLFLCSVSWKGLKEMILPTSERNYDINLWCKSINLWLEELVMHVLNQGMEILSPEDPLSLQGWSCLQFPCLSLTSPLYISLSSPKSLNTRRTTLESSDLREMCQTYINSWIYHYDGLFLYFVAYSSFLNF